MICEMELYEYGQQFEATTSSIPRLCRPIPSAVERALRKVNRRESLGPVAILVEIMQKTM